MKLFHRFCFTLFILLVTAVIGVLSVSAGLESLLLNLYPRAYRDIVSFYAEEYGLPENLVYSLIKTESGFSPGVVSSKGARGLTQITEETFLWLKGKLDPDMSLDHSSLNQPELSIRYGAFFLSLCMERYGRDIPTAAAAYHSGWGTVDSLLENSSRTLTAFPYEQMNRYVRKIINAMRWYDRLYGGEDITT